METWNEIDEWIARYRQGELSEENRAKLIRWLEASPEHEKQFQDMLETEIRVDAVGKWGKLDRMQERVWLRIAPVLVSRKRQLYIWGLRVAAVITLLVGVFFVWQERQEPKEKSVSIASILQVEAGSSRAILETSSGVKIELKEGETCQVADIAGVSVIQDSTGGVRLEDTGDSGEKGIENSTIVVPKEGEYFVELSDGTRVWINSDSRLEFPNRFHGDTREVKLKGEAYFEVASNPEKPFYVHAEEAEVRVLGTAFNVMAYEDDKRTEVALLHGKVSFDAGKNACVLAPGEIAILDRASGQTTVRKGDVGAIVDWKKGRFNFEDMPLEELIAKLSRWYGVTFVFGDDAARHLRFSGAVTKYRTLDYVLNMISKTTDVAFAEKEGKIVIHVK